MRSMQANHYREVMDYIESYRSELPDSVYADPSYSFRVYLIYGLDSFEPFSRSHFRPYGTMGLTGG